MRLSIVATAIYLSVGGFAVANNVDQASQKKPGELEEIVVTSHYEFLSADTSGTTNLPLPIEQVPQSISLVSNDFIKAADVKTLGEIAEYTPGAVNTGNQALGATLKLRGFTAGESLDGVNILSGYTYFEPDYAIYDRLEIVKGPSSVVYGVSSPGGLVNFVTKAATAETPTYVTAQAGFWSNYRLEGQIAHAIDADQHVRAIGVAVQDQGNSFQDGLYHKTTTLYGGLNFDFDHVTAYVHAGFERQRVTYTNGVPTEPDGSPAPVPRSFFIGLSGTADTTNVYHTEEDLTWHASDVLEFSIKGNYQNARYYGPTGYGFGLQSPSGGCAVGVLGCVGLAVGTTNVHTFNYGIGASSIYKFDDLGLKDSFVSVGALYQNYGERFGVAAPTNSVGIGNIFDGEAAVNQVLASLNAAPNTSVFELHTKAETLTFSAQSVVKIIDPLSVLVGVSYSKPKESTDFGPGTQPQYFDIAGQVSYRAGVTYEVLPKTYAYASYSQSFNPQSYIAVGGATLPPVKGEQYEVGLKSRQAGGRLLLTAAIFQIQEKDVAQFYKHEMGFDYYQAAGEVRHRGFELQSIGRITAQWQINAGYTYLDPRITEGNVNNSGQTGQTELFLPKQTFSVYSTYALQNRVLSGLSFGGGVRYVASQRTSYGSALANEQNGLSPTKDIPSYTVVDLNLGYTLAKWLFQLNAHNILDRHYYVNNYQTLLYGNLPGDPANLALSVRREF